MNQNALKPDKWGLTEVKIDRCTYSWTISNYNYLCKRPGEKLESPYFSIGNKERNWFLRLYPNGINENFKNFVSLYLCRDPNIECKFEGHYILSVLNEKCEKFLEEKEDCSYNKNYTSWGFAEFIPRDSIQDQVNNLLPDNCLTINCDIAIVVGCKSISSEDEEKIQNRLEVRSGPCGLEKLFLDERLSDVRLVAACGKKLPAHRSVLAASSSVFEAMFANDMLERTADEVKIADGEYEALKEMLRFIYSGKLENVAIVAADLLKLADKYEITGLSELCEIELSDMMSVSNVLDILVIADRHEIEHLKTRGINFTKAHLKDVVNSDGFKSLSHVQVLKCIIETISQQ